VAPYEDSEEEELDESGDGMDLMREQLFAHFTRSHSLPPTDIKTVESMQKHESTSDMERDDSQQIQHEHEQQHSMRRPHMLAPRHQPSIENHGTIMEEEENEDDVAVLQSNISYRADQSAFSVQQHDVFVKQNRGEFDALIERQQQIELVYEDDIQDRDRSLVISARQGIPSCTSVAALARS